MSKCPICGNGLQPVSGAGRPRRYCSAACRRMGEMEVKRIAERLKGLEEREMSTRLASESYPWDDDPRQLAKEIERQRTRLRELLERLEGEQ